MEKRALLAIVISMAILVLSQPLLVKYRPRQNQPQKASVNANPEPAATVAPQVQKTEQPPQPVKQADEKDIIFDNEEYHVILSNAGGVIKSVTLKKHFDSNGKPMVLFDEQNPSDATFAVAGLGPALDKTVFSSSMRPNGIVFTAKSPDGLSVEKEITFRPGNYAIDLRQTLTNYSNQSRDLKYSIVSGAGLTSLSPQDEMYFDLVKEIDGKVTNVNKRWVENPVPWYKSIVNAIFHLSVDKKTIENSLKWEGAQVNWVSLKAKYFSLITKPPVSFKLVCSKKLPDNKLQSQIYSDNFTIAPNSSVTHDFVTYAGPNEYKNIRNLKLGFEDSLYLGFTGSIGRILFVILEHIHIVAKNWGLSIILLTAFINILLFPLTFKGIKSMKQMQALQPKMETLRKTHKNDPQKLNKEVMELYKRYKINPMTGCLPLILQMPVFFALYQVLLRSIELRGAPFLWIKDLSQPDRLIIFKAPIPFMGNELNILPILMAIAMFFQQRLSAPANPAADDQMAQQQKMMMVMMPVLFGFIFYHLPSGLVMYWLTNTLLTVTEQEMFLKKQLFHVEQSEN